MTNWKAKLRTFAQEFNQAPTPFAQERLLHDMYNSINDLEKRIEELEAEHDRQGNKL